MSKTGRQEAIEYDIEELERRNNQPSLRSWVVELQQLWKLRDAAEAALRWHDQIGAPSGPPATQQQLDQWRQVFPDLRTALAACGIDVPDRKPR